jgi:hypothetical protein
MTDIKRMLASSPEVVNGLNKHFRGELFFLNGYYQRRVDQAIPQELLAFLGVDVIRPEEVGVTCEFNPLAMLGSVRYTSMVNFNPDWAATKNTLVKIIDHELGHSKRPPKSAVPPIPPHELEIARKAGKIKELRRKGLRIPRKQMRHEHKPEEWDANMHALIDYYERLTPEAKAEISYDELLQLALPDLYGSYRNAPTWWKRYISRLNREGIRLSR